MKNQEIKIENTWEKVTLQCGRVTQSAYAGDGCGNCETNTNNSGKATCC